MRVLDLAQAICPECEIVTIGIRPGEKLHEVLLSEDEARHSLELSDQYVITPAHPWWKGQSVPAGRPLPVGFRYASDTNTEWLDIPKLHALVGEEKGTAMAEC
jgi:UDP-N-acetylglucosamine 4,6-dehydratase